MGQFKALFAFPHTWVFAILIWIRQQANREAIHNKATYKEHL